MIVLSRMSLEASELRIGTFREELMQKNPTWPSPQPYQHKYSKTKNGMGMLRGHTHMSFTPFCPLKHIEKLKPSTRLMVSTLQTIEMSLLPHFKKKT